MKYSRLFFAFILIISAFSVQAQTIIDTTQLRITYQLSYRNSSKESQPTQERMLLLIGKQQSKFTSLNKHLLDSMVEQLADPTLLLGNMQNMPRTKFNYAIYKPYAGEKLLFRDRVAAANYEYREPKALFDWQLSGEQKKIKGLLCQKATMTFRGRNYEAWFSPEIPVSDGPYKFNGLPGLIVEIKDQDEDYHFSLLSLEKPSSIVPIKQSTKQFQEVSREKYRKAVENSKDNFLGQLAQKGITIKLSAQQKRKLNNKMKADDNPIEL